MTKNKSKIKILFTTKKGSCPPEEHARILEQLKAMGYDVVDGQLNNTGDIRDVRVEILPGQ